MHWLKKLFRGQPDHADPRLVLDKGADVSVLTLQDCDQAGIELGRQIDALREQRRAIRARADALRAERFACEAKRGA